MEPMTVIELPTIPTCMTSAIGICTRNEWVAQSIICYTKLHDEALESNLVKNVAEVWDF